MDKWNCVLEIGFDFKIVGGNEIILTNLIKNGSVLLYEFLVNIVIKKAYLLLFFYFVVIAGGCAESYDASLIRHQDLVRQNLYEISKKPYQKLLIIGNSITCHGPSTEKLGWDGSWGMAATSLEKDYAHVFYELLSDTQPEKNIELHIESLLATNIKATPSMLSFNPDILIIQIGDNLADSKATKESFYYPYKKMIEQFIEVSNPTILCVSDWDYQHNKRLYLEKICSEYNNVKFVDISKIGQDDKNRALSEGIYKHTGVAWHPGDKGMEKIAEELFNTLFME